MRITAVLGLVVLASCAPTLTEDNDYLDEPIAPRALSESKPIIVELGPEPEVHSKFILVLIEILPLLGCLGSA